MYIIIYWVNSCFKVYADRACKRTINTLEVRCQHFGKECEWSGELANLPVSNLSYQYTLNWYLTCVKMYVGQVE